MVLGPNNAESDEDEAVPEDRESELLDATLKGGKRGDAGGVESGAKFGEDERPFCLL